MSDSAVSIGIDIGGTGAKGGLVTANGEVLAQKFAATADGDSRESVLSVYETMIADLLQKAHGEGWQVQGIGVGVPGYIDDSCSAMTYGNIRSIEGFPLRKHLADRFGLPVRLDNDANCAALAEYYWGGGKDCRRLVVVTVGSGIGVGVIIDGKMLRYTFGTAGELGSIVVDARGGNESFLGGRGGLESVASARAIMAAAEVLDPQPADVAELSDRARQDTIAADIISQAGWWLGVGIAGWAVIFAPQLVLIGGGVAACGETFLSAVRQSAAEMVPAFYGKNLKIEPAHLGGRAGFMGACSLILKNPD